jgi:hypothetical protein
MVVPQLSSGQQLVEFVDGEPTKFTLVTTDHRLHLKAPSLEVKQVCKHVSVRFVEPVSLACIHLSFWLTEPVCMHLCTILVSQSGSVHLVRSTCRSSFHTHLVQLTEPVKLD